MAPTASANSRSRAATPPPKKNVSEKAEANQENTRAEDKKAVAEAPAAAKAVEPQAAKKPEEKVKAPEGCRYCAAVRAVVFTRRALYAALAALVTCSVAVAVFVIRAGLTMDDCKAILVSQGAEAAAAAEGAFNAVAEKAREHPASARAVAAVAALPVLWLAFSVGQKAVRAVKSRLAARRESLKAKAA